jgi:hypothetical protein
MPICTGGNPRQGCHHRRFWMKMSIQTSFSYADVRPRPHLLADAGPRGPVTSPPLSLPPLCLSAWKERKNLQFTIFGFRFSVFNPQTPPTPRAPRASRAKPREEEGFFGLIPLVTHPSSILLLGGLTPKFLSLSLHSL